MRAPESAVARERRDASGDALRPPLPADARLAAVPREQRAPSLTPRGAGSIDAVPVLDGEAEAHGGLAGGVLERAPVGRLLPVQASHGVTRENATRQTLLGMAMNLPVTTSAEPHDRERLRVVGMVPLNSAGRSASRATQATCHIAAPHGGVESLPRPALERSVPALPCAVPCTEPLRVSAARANHVLAVCVSRQVFVSRRETLSDVTRLAAGVQAARVRRGGVERRRRKERETPGATPALGAVDGHRPPALPARGRQRRQALGDHLRSQRNTFRPAHHATSRRNVTTQTQQLLSHEQPGRLPLMDCQSDENDPRAGAAPLE